MPTPTKTATRNVSLTLVEARIFDEPSSPYADAVESAKAILKSLENER